MNRISRRSAAEVAEALLEVGRTQPVLHYDVDLGLARHHDWLRSEAPLPEWAASASAAATSQSVTPLVIKTIVSALLIGAVGIAGWHARGRQPPSAADVKQSSPGAERVQAIAPSVPEVTASEAWMLRTPMPVSDPGAPSDQPARQTVRADAPGKHSTRSQRAHKQRPSARLASARAESEPPGSASDLRSHGTVARTSVPAEATPARVELAAPASTQPSLSVERATRPEVAADSKPKPNSPAHTGRPEPGQQAQVPDLVEMQQVATAEQLLERSPQRALVLVRQGDERFAHGYFQQERAYIAIMALIRLGRIEEARARAASFDKHFPALPYAARIRSALEAARETVAAGAAARDGVQ